MTSLTIELRADEYEQLADAAKRSGKQPAALVVEWVTERLPVAIQVSERERVHEVLRAAGLLAEPSEAMLALAARADMSLEEVQEALDQAGGQPLSELILEMRGPNNYP